MKLYASYENYNPGEKPFIKIHVEKSDCDYRYFIGRTGCDKFLPYPSVDFGKEIVDHILFNVDKEQLRSILQQRDLSDKLQNCEE